MSQDIDIGDHDQDILENNPGGISCLQALQPLSGCSEQSKSTSGGQASMPVPSTMGEDKSHESRRGNSKEVPERNPETSKCCVCCISGMWLLETFVVRIMDCNILCLHLDV